MTNSRLALFAFGTLMDPDVLGIVARQDPATLVREAASVADHARRWVLDDHYPVLVPSPGQHTVGLIIRGLQEQAMSRIEFFEGDEFTLRTLFVENAAGDREEVCYFADNQRQPISTEEWLLEQWQAATKAQTLPRVERYMRCYGKMTTTEADAYW